MTQATLNRDTYRKVRSELIALGQLEDALSVNMSWTSQHPNDPHSFYELAWIQAANKLQNEGLHSINIAIELDEGNEQYRAMKVSLLQALGPAEELTVAQCDLARVSKKNVEMFLRETELSRRQIIESTLAHLSAAEILDDSSTIRKKIYCFLEPLMLDTVKEWAIRIEKKYGAGDIADVPNTGKFLIDNVGDVIQKRLCRGMCWEPRILSMMHALNSAFKERVSFIEIGANIGSLTVPISKMISGPCWGFEPNPSALEILSNNLLLNDCDDVLVHKTALGAESGRATPIGVNETNLGATRYSTINESHHNENLEQVDVRPLDDFVASWEEVYQKNQTVIKIDVEGMEADVLGGGYEFIRKFKPIILIEVWASNLENVSELAFQLGYKIQSIGEDDYLLLPFD